jgi:hypothetical protein
MGLFPKFYNKWIKMPATYKLFSGQMSILAKYGIQRFFSGIINNPLAIPLTTWGCQLMQDITG